MACLLRLGLATFLWLCLQAGASVARAELPPYAVRVSVQLGFMTSRDQIERMGYNKPAKLVDVQLMYLARPWLDLQLGLLR